MIDYSVFAEMNTEEIEKYLEKGETPVRTDFGNAEKDLPKDTGFHKDQGETPVRTDFGNAEKDLPKDTGFHKDQGETPIRDNEVETKKGQDPVDPKDGDVDDFAKGCDDNFKLASKACDDNFELESMSVLDKIVDELFAESSDILVEEIENMELVESENILDEEMEIEITSNTTEGLMEEVNSMELDENVEAESEVEALDEGCKEECDKADCKNIKKPVEVNEVTPENEAIKDEEFDVDSEYDNLLKEEEEELAALDEELKDIESFLENYIDEE